MERRQRLVDFVTDTGSHLPKHSQLPGLNRIVARLAQDAFGALERFDTLFQRNVGCLQIRRSLGDPLLQLLMHLPQPGFGQATFVVAPDT